MMLLVIMAALVRHRSQAQAHEYRKHAMLVLCALTNCVSPHKKSNRSAANPSSFRKNSSNAKLSAVRGGVRDGVDASYGEAGGGSDRVDDGGVVVVVVIVVPFPGATGVILTVCITNGRGCVVTTSGCNAYAR